jgi:Glycosyl hydrolase family 63 C-terminal domain
VNRKDPEGRNVFAGGFLGLDNIGVFDRSAPLPTGGSLEQADGTAWMAFYCQVMLEIAVILSDEDPQYEEHAFTFLQHFVWIAYAMDRIGEHHDEMWDEADGFFYDVLRLPDGSATRLKVRSMVGLLPLCASTVFGADDVARHPRLLELVTLFRERHPEVVAQVAPTAEGYLGYANRRLFSPLSQQRLERVLGYLLDENEFLSPYGIRSLSRYHRDHPFVFAVDGQAHSVSYLPGESNTGMFGGNSNWRGPIWIPVNTLIIRGLLNLYAFYGDAFTVECPTGSGQRMTLFDVAREITRRLARIFLRDASGRRPVYGGTATFQEDPHWRDLLLFYEYFHGENGAGLGASHQTGWTGVIAMLLDLFGRITPEDILTAEKGQLAERLTQESARGTSRRRRA